MWGQDLWDQYDGVCGHLDNRLDQIKKISAFVKDRIKVEQDYAKELRKLSKSYNKMKPEETKFPSTECFFKVVNNADELAHHHEMLSNKLQSEVYDGLKKLVADQTKEKKVAMSDATKQQATYAAALASNEKVKKKYEGVQQDADKAHVGFQKADADMALSRAAVEKIRKQYELKQGELEEAKSTYLSSIDDTNKSQQDHFTVKMPVIFKQLQELDETRTSEMVKHLVSYINLESELLPMVTEMERKVKVQCESVDPKEDSAQLIEELATGQPMPPDLVIEESAPAPLPDKKSKKGSQCNSTSISSNTSVDLYESLPPAKRKKKLLAKVSDLKASAKKEESELKALEKMTSVYMANPSLGDPKVVQQKIQPLIGRCDAINEEMYKVECVLAHLDNKEPPFPPSPVTTTAFDITDVPAENTVECVATADESVKKSASATWSDEFDSTTKCSVLYDFTASAEGELSVSYGEVLDLVEDDGSGWISVRRGSCEPGYIPLTYVQML